MQVFFHVSNDLKFTENIVEIHSCSHSDLILYALYVHYLGASLYLWIGSDIFPLLTKIVHSLISNNGHLDLDLVNFMYYYCIIFKINKLKLLPNYVPMGNSTLTIQHHEAAISLFCPE